MVEYTLDGHIATITIRRPEARNAVNGEVAKGIEAAIDNLEEDGEAWVGILTGEGTVFSAGADLKLVSSGQAGEMTTQKGGFAGIARRERTKPIIAAVDGPALAGGCEIALSCDLIVASGNARFGLPEVKRSLVAGAGGLFRLARAIPRNVAMEVALTGDPIEADRAYTLGLVNELVAPGEAVAAARALAERIVVNAPIAVRESRKVVMAATTADEDSLWSITNQAFGLVARTEDFGEGPRAFIEKRAPQWKGR